MSPGGFLPMTNLPGTPVSRSAFITDDGRLETYVGSLGGDGLADIIEKLIVA